MDPDLGRRECARYRARMRIHERFFSGGEWLAASGGASIEVVDPATEQAIARVPDCSPGEVDRAVSAARAAFEPWSRTTPAERASYLSAIAAGLAQKMRLEDAVARARAYVQAAIRNAPGYGKGHGPLDHAVTVDPGLIGKA